MDIYTEIISALSTEGRAMLATIISTSGSTPASAFSKMLVKEGGTVSVGTVGGGCMEGDVLIAAKRLYQEQRAEILTFHLNEDEFVQGLICGGNLDILVEPLTKKDIPFFEELKARRDEGEDSIAATFINSDKTVQFRRLVGVPDLNRSNGLMVEWISSTQSDLSEELQKAYRRNETRRINAAQGELILEPIAGNPGLIIFGGGHVSKQVCRIAAGAGFRVTIVDDREHYANLLRFPEAAQTIASGFAGTLEKLSIGASTFIVIVTRGHRYDEEILERVLTTSAKYIGMIGSKKKVFATYEHLVERGVTVESLRRVHAPMGIEIGSTTAEEIGVSIVAELVAVRRGVEAPYAEKSLAMQDLLSRLERGKMKEEGGRS